MELKLKTEKASLKLTTKGIPFKQIAVFVGNHVSVQSTEMKNSTKFTVDGHRLFAYRCDYTVYPMSSIKSSVANKVID